MSMAKVLITRPRAQAGSFAEGLRKAGFEPVFFPVIEISPLENNLALHDALRNLAGYDWLVFTSVNGVDAVWRALSELGTASLPAGVRVAAIGPKTALAIEAHGILPAFVPGEYVAEALLPGMGDLHDSWVLLPRAEIARKALPEAIAQAGGVAHEIVVYRTLPTEPDAQGLRALHRGVDVITLTSPSTVHNFAAMTRSAGLDPLDLPGKPIFACIGPITHQAAREENLPECLVASEYTTEGLLKALRSVKMRL